MCGAEAPTDGHGQARAQLTAAEAEAEARGHRDARAQGGREGGGAGGHGDARARGGGGGGGGGGAVRLRGPPFRSPQPWRKRLRSSRLRRGARSRRMRCPSCAAARWWRARSARACCPPAPGCSSSATKKGRPRPACCPTLRCCRTGTRPPVRQRINREAWETGEDACRYANSAAPRAGLRPPRAALCGSWGGGRWLAPRCSSSWTPPPACRWRDAASRRQSGRTCPRGRTLEN